MNWHGVKAIYVFEMARMRRTLMQSVASPVLSTSLYFIVFGAAIGARVERIDGIDYGAFIVPGLIMMAVLTQSVSNGSFGIYMPRFSGTIYELLSAPISPLEAVLGGLPRLQDSRSLSRYGLSQITVVFQEGTDIYFARQLVSERLQAARNQLPDGLEPTLGPISTGLGEISQWTVEAEPGTRKPDAYPKSGRRSRTRIAVRKSTSN